MVKYTYEIVKFGTIYRDEKPLMIPKNPISIPLDSTVGGQIGASDLPSFSLDSYDFSIRDSHENDEFLIPWVHVKGDNGIELYIADRCLFYDKVNNIRKIDTTKQVIIDNKEYYFRPIKHSEYAEFIANIKDNPSLPIVTEKEKTNKAYLDEIEMFNTPSNKLWNWYTVSSYLKEYTTGFSNDFGNNSEFKKLPSNLTTFYRNYAFRPVLIKIDRSKEKDFENKKPSFSNKIDIVHSGIVDDEGFKFEIVSNVDYDVIEYSINDSSEFSVVDDNIIPSDTFGYGKSCVNFQIKNKNEVLQTIVVYVIKKLKNDSSVVDVIESINNTTNNTGKQLLSINEYFNNKNIVNNKIEDVIPNIDNLVKKSSGVIFDGTDGIGKTIMCETITKDNKGNIIYQIGNDIYNTDNEKIYSIPNIYTIASIDNGKIICINKKTSMIEVIYMDSGEKVSYGELGSGSQDSNSWTFNLNLITDRIVEGLFYSRSSDVMQFSQCCNIINGEKFTPGHGMPKTDWGVKYGNFNCEEGWYTKVIDSAAIGWDYRFFVIDMEDGSVIKQDTFYNKSIITPRSYDLYSKSQLTSYKTYPSTSYVQYLLNNKGEEVTRVPHNECYTIINKEHDVLFISTNDGSWKVTSHETNDVIKSGTLPPSSSYKIYNTRTCTSVFNNDNGEYYVFDEKTLSFSTYKINIGKVYEHDNSEKWFNGLPSDHRHVMYSSSTVLDYNYRWKTGNRGVLLSLDLRDFTYKKINLPSNGVKYAYMSHDNKHIGFGLFQTGYKEFSIGEDGTLTETKSLELEIVGISKHGLIARKYYSSEQAGYEVIVPGSDTNEIVNGFGSQIIAAITTYNPKTSHAIEYIRHENNLCTVNVYDEKSGVYIGSRKATINVSDRPETDDRFNMRRAYNGVITGAQHFNCDGKCTITLSYLDICGINEFQGGEGGTVKVKLENNMFKDIAYTPVHIQCESYDGSVLYIADNSIMKK